MIGNRKQYDYMETDMEEYLDMNDIMHSLRCSRYIVMKYYNTAGLPLIRINKKYYIKRNKLEKWKEVQRKRKIMLGFVLLFILIIMLVFIFIGIY